MTDLQWLSSKVNMLWVIYLGSLQGLLGTFWDMEDKSLAKSLADEQGRMLMARVWGFHAFALSWESQEIAWTTTCEDYKQLGTSCLPFNRLSSKPQQSQKISQNAVQHSMSISSNSIELAKPQQTQKSSQNAARGGGGCVHFLEYSTYWLLQSQDGHKRLPKVPRDFSKFHAIHIS